MINGSTTKEQDSLLRGQQWSKVFVLSCLAFWVLFCVEAPPPSTSFQSTADTLWRKNGRFTQAQSGRTAAPQTRKANTGNFTAVPMLIPLRAPRSRVVHRKKQWRTPQHSERNRSMQGQSIEPGDQGIWATCDMGKEKKCIGELRDLFDEVEDVTLQVS